ncbi:hypothetical protein CK203_003256 [Vitis vinifera]|uniref:Retroviral polymerase SH3-like domain-containing protein n=1 Tax=Vitis vinifera TaxID=29760 RepID=A0A438K714_VITVI|nr:hypothetical protein CK203_003256 [Vitis vinifera]
MSANNSIHSTTKWCLREEESNCNGDGQIAYKILEEQKHHMKNEPKRSKLDSRAQKGILIGYGTSTKGYRIFCLQTNKVVLSRNVKVDEMATWDYDFPVRGIRSLEDIYQRCSLAITEPTSYVEAKDSEAWRRAMQKN